MLFQDHFWLSQRIKILSIAWYACNSISCLYLTVLVKTSQNKLILNAQAAIYLKKKKIHEKKDHIFEVGEVNGIKPAGRQMCKSSFLQFS